MPAKRKNPTKRAKKMLKRSPCVRAVIAADKSGAISDTQAQAIIDDIYARYQADKGKYISKKDQQLADIAGEMKATEATNNALAKRNMLLQYRITKDLLPFIKQKQFKTLGDGMIKHLEQVDLVGKAISMRFMRRLIAQWEADDVFKDAKADFPGLDFFREVWALSDGKPRATKNDLAFKLAKGYWDIKDETISLKNMLGAMINRAAGHVIVQSHDAAKLQAGGPLKLFGNSDLNVEESFKAWSKWMEDNVKIDWKRTLDGRAKDGFLREFHKSIYSNLYTNDVDSIFEMTQFKTHGSLANKMSSRRVLWFEDADSAFKYHEAWGRKAIFDEIFDEINRSGRQIAILQGLGPNPKSTIDTVRKMGLKHIRDDLPEKMWKKQKASLEGKAIDNLWFELSGASQNSVRPKLSRFIDNVKGVILMSHSGRMVFPSLFGDQALMLSGAMYQGVKAADFFRMRFKTLKPLTPERERALAQTSFVAHSYIGNLIRGWQYDMRPGMLIERGTGAAMRLNLLQTVTNANERSATEIGSMILGGHAGTKWSALDGQYRTLLERYNFNEAMWETIRHKAYEVKDYGGSKVLTDELAENLTDAEIGSYLASVGEAATTANAKRARLKMQTAIGVYLTDFMHFSVGRPTMKLRAIKGQGIGRGEFFREASELFFIFKSFPVMAWLRAVESVKRHYVPKGDMDPMKWMGANSHFAVWLSSYAAMTYFAGIVAQTLGDITMGRDPLPIYDKDTGMPIWKSLVRHLARGGGLGIMGDIFMSEYDRGMRDIFDVSTGPALGQLTALTRLYSIGVKGALGDEASQEKFPFYGLKQLERNTPFLNLFYIRPLYDQLIGWHLKEVLSPGSLKRMERSIQRDNLQGHWLPPTDSLNRDPSDLSGKISDLLGHLDEIDMSFGADAPER